MFPGIHDSLLIGYTVNAESREVILLLRPHQGSASASFAVVFEGVVAHSFDAPLLPAILAEIIPVSADMLITSRWSSIEQGFKKSGWPGPWADTLANATRFAQDSGIQAFQIESSYGLSGWVLAHSARVDANSVSRNLFVGC
jgi:hypothetical protein